MRVIFFFLCDKIRCKSALTYYHIYYANDSGEKVKKIQIIHSRKLIQAIDNVILLATDKCDLEREGCLKLAIAVYVPDFKMIKLKIVFVLGLGDIFLISQYLYICTKLV